MIYIYFFFLLCSVEVESSILRESLVRLLDFFTFDYGGSEDNASFSTISGPKDLPVIARAAGRLAGRGTGYVQLARGQFEKIMQQSEVHKVCLSCWMRTLDDWLMLCPLCLFVKMVIWISLGVIYCAGE